MKEKGGEETKGREGEEGTEGKFYLWPCSLPLQPLVTDVSHNLYLNDVVKGRGKGKGRDMKGQGQKGRDQERKSFERAGRERSGKQARRERKKRERKKG